MRTIDIHAYWYPEEWLKLFENDVSREGARLERSAKLAGIPAPGGDHRPRA